MPHYGIRCEDLAASSRPIFGPPCAYAVKPPAWRHAPGARLLPFRYVSVGRRGLARVPLWRACFALLRLALFRSKLTCVKAGQGRAMHRRRAWG
jgi:hypothetical protein